MNGVEQKIMSAPSEQTESLNAQLCNLEDVLVESWQSLFPYGWTDIQENGIEDEVKRFVSEKCITLNSKGFVERILRNPPNKENLLLTNYVSDLQCIPLETNQKRKPLTDKNAKCKKRKTLSKTNR